MLLSVLFVQTGFFGFCRGIRRSLVKFFFLRRWFSFFSGLFYFVDFLFLLTQLGFVLNFWRLILQNFGRVVLLNDFFFPSNMNNVLVIGHSPLLERTPNLFMQQLRFFRVPVIAEYLRSTGIFPFDFINLLFFRLELESTSLYGSGLVFKSFLFGDKMKVEEGAKSFAPSCFSGVFTSPTLSVLTSFFYFRVFWQFAQHLCVKKSHFRLF